MTNKKLLVIKTGSTLPSIKAESGDFENWILDGMGINQDQVIIRDVEKGELLPVVKTLSGAVITGSHAMVSDHLSWSEVTAGWLRSAVKSGLPVLGICFGHQLLVHALGGSTDFNPQGPEYGTVDIELLSHAADDPLFQNLPKNFKAQVSHQQSALNLPKDSIILARSSRDPHQAFRFGNCCWGIQFHPEFSPEITTAYIKGSHQELIEKGLLPDEMIASCLETPEAASLLKGFASIIRT